MKNFAKAVVVVALSALLLPLSEVKRPTEIPATLPTTPEIVATVIEPIPTPEPEPVIEPAPEPYTRPATSGGCELAYNYDWPADVAHSICMKESSGNPNAANHADNHMSWAGCMGSYGLMQINCSHGQVFDPVENMSIAYSMYRGWGNSFRAWTTCARVANCY